MSSRYKQNVFADMLASGLKAAGLTQEDLAAAAGVGQQAASKWLLGASLPDVARLAPIAAVLNLDYVDVLGAFTEAASRPISPREPKTRSTISTQVLDLARRVDRLESRLDALQKGPSGETLG